MSPRRLNIERRRKRIRHYTARRRQRSPVRRAFVYWWSTAVIGASAILLLGEVALGFATRRPSNATRALPRAGLGFIIATAEEVSGIVRTGNARRLSTALSDADIGISLAPNLPEPSRREPSPLSPLPEPTLEATAEHGQVAVALLPSFTDSIGGKSKEASRDPVIRTRMDAGLVSAGFAVKTWPAVPIGKEDGAARFWLTLDAEGRPETVLRLSPKGAEDVWFRQLRMALAAGRGDREASGIVTVLWNAKEGK